MKVILTGSTGFIGREVLEQCLQNPSITSIVALSRRDLPRSNPKLKTVILDNFLEYPESVAREFEAADACIWCLGKARVPDNDTARKICLEYTMAAVKKISDIGATARRATKQKFRFVYLSGGAAERDQSKPLWFMQDYRRVRGEVENQLLAHADAYGDTFEVCILRPGLVLAKERNFVDVVKGLGPSVRVDRLAGAMILRALSGGGRQVVENGEIGS
ncbi:MAG: hypothetical protein L6R38_005246 [Xanthoria sp. 2 TBL-2021]|nr:MAG: hypothetical protein L6R38_005246 [Xanthoria sp. 2 TBL-2021]